MTFGGHLSWRPLSFQIKRAMSAFGTKRTNALSCRMVAIGPTTDKEPTLALNGSVAIDPERTSVTILLALAVVL